MSEVFLGRVLTAMATPFANDGSVDLEIAAQLANRLIASGSDGIVVCGTTGESPTLSPKEREDLFRTVVRAVGDRAKVVAGAGANSTAAAIAATQAAAAIGVDATLQVVPYYNKPPQAGLYEHFRTIAAAVPELPVMLYDVPGRTSRALEVETILKLAEIENIVALKDASGDLNKASQVCRGTSAEFSVYAGDDALTLPILAVGGVGVVSVASHLVGDRLQEMIQAFEVGQVVRAREIHGSLLPLFEALFLEPNPIPVRAALTLQGWPMGKPRLPLVPLAPGSKQILQEMLEKQGFL
ncbi:MAG: 4-hydroxy-tetrahydrodipicolinate synthase [Cyanobacteria bacterium J06641_5]